MSQTAKPNYINDNRLSLRARGLMTLLLADPERSRTAEDIARTVPEGRDAIRTALRELEEAGHLIRRRVQGPDGRWMTLTDLHEVSP